MSKAYPCIYCTDDLKCTKYTDDEATSFCVLGPCKYEKPSNADRIRAMSDEEMAEFLENLGICPEFDNELCNNLDGCPEGDSCWLRWLKKEANNG